MGKQRDAAKTREAILHAARLKFTEKGYDAAGVREIAETAGVNVALINRYFGSKDGLFREAVIPFLSLDPLLAGDTQDLAHRLGEYMVNKDYSKDVFDPMLAVLRSAGSEAVQSMFKEVVDSDVIGKLSEQIDQENAQQRAGLIVALLFGFDALNRIFEVEVFSEADQQKVSTLFADTIQSLLS